MWLEAAGHIASEGRKQGELNSVAQFIFSFLFCPRLLSHVKGFSTVRVGLASPVNPV